MRWRRFILAALTTCIGGGGAQEVTGLTWYNGPPDVLLKVSDDLRTVECHAPRYSKTTLDPPVHVPFIPATECYWPCVQVELVDYTGPAQVWVWIDYPSLGIVERLHWSIEAAPRCAEVSP